MRATVLDDLVEVSIDDDGQLDVLRDVIADLELPLHRLSTRRTSLDEVFLGRAHELHDGSSDGRAAHP